MSHKVTEPEKITNNYACIAELDALLFYKWTVLFICSLSTCFSFLFLQARDVISLGDPWSTGTTKFFNARPFFVTLIPDAEKNIYNLKIMVSM